MSPLELAVHQANARYRAWVAHGLPLEARCALDRHKGIPRVYLCCTRCDRGTLDSASLTERWLVESIPVYALGDTPEAKDIRDREAAILDWIQSGRIYPAPIFRDTIIRTLRCRHLQPMQSGWMPEAVRALYEIELIAGG